MKDVGAILIVDHDVRFATFAAGLFERAGFSTTEAATGAEGVAAARSERPALVLLEVCLPDINGFEISRQLRDEFGEDLPIIFVSGERTIRSIAQRVCSSAATTTWSSPVIPTSCSLACGGSSRVRRTDASRGTVLQATPR